MLTGFYRVDEAERGVVQRFGAFTETSLPGLRWHLPYPIETVDLVNTTAISNYAYRTEMLTADEQYVFIDMVVQFRREDPVKYSFEVVDPDMTLQDVTESALREVEAEPQIEALCWFLDADRSGDARWDWFSLAQGSGRMTYVAEEFDVLLWNTE